jgi:hypothetical protein
MNWIKSLFKRRLRVKLFNTEVATEAFRDKNGKAFYTFNDAFKMPAGRGICAIAIYEELRMRCTAEYLAKHVRAMELLLSPADKRLRLNEIAQLNQNLKDRLALAPFPDHIYKLASVTFFDETENPNSYDFAYNQRKIEKWKQDPDMLDFFLQTQFKELMPFTSSPDISVSTFFEVSQQIDTMHLKSLSAIISNNN